MLENRHVLFVWLQEYLLHNFIEIGLLQPDVLVLLVELVDERLTDVRHMLVLHAIVDVYAVLERQDPELVLFVELDEADQSFVHGLHVGLVGELGNVPFNLVQLLHFKFLKPLSVVVAADRVEAFADLQVDQSGQAF